jgi:hypothetical protein
MSQFTGLTPQEREQHFLNVMDSITFEETEQHFFCIFMTKWGDEFVTLHKDPFNQLSLEQGRQVVQLKAMEQFFTTESSRYKAMQFEQQNMQPQKQA